MAAPAFGSVGSQLAGTSSTAANLPVPASVAANDIILVELFIDGGSAIAVTPPAGFTECPGSPAINIGAGDHYARAYWKRATGADSGTYNFTLASSTFRQGVASRFTGCITTGNPIDAGASSVTSGASTTTAAVSVTTTGADRLLVWFATGWAGGTYTPPASFTERFDSDLEGAVLTFADLAQAAAGSSGSLTGTGTGSTGRASLLVALTPTGGAAATSLAPSRRLNYGSLLQF